jgi:hypothetical protein
MKGEEGKWDFHDINLDGIWVRISRCAWGQIVPTKKNATDTRPSQTSIGKVFFR